MSKINASSKAIFKLITFIALIGGGVTFCLLGQSSSASAIYVDEVPLSALCNYEKSFGFCKDINIIEISVNADEKTKIMIYRAVVGSLMELMVRNGVSEKTIRIAHKKENDAACDGCILMAIQYSNGADERLDIKYSARRGGNFLFSSENRIEQKFGSLIDCVEKKANYFGSVLFKINDIESHGCGE